MADLVVIVPTRGRPEAAVELVEAFGATRTSAHLVFAVDLDDPKRDEYWAALGGPHDIIDTGGQPSTMVRALNASAVKRATSDDPPFAIGFCGDDHRPRGVWEEPVLAALREMGTGMVYGDDGFQHERLPTAIFMTSDIIRVLGYMSPPELRHLYVDTAWLDLGRAAGCIRYLPDVKVTHVHPIAAGIPVEEWDEGHRRVNSKEMYASDLAAFNRWKYMDLPAAAAKVRALRGERVTISRGRMSEGGPMEPPTVTYG